MDAIVAMEGDGPGLGDPRHVGLLLVSTSPLALDVVASEIMNIPRETNPVLIEAEGLGLVPNQMSQIQLIGANIEDISIPDFKAPPLIYAGPGYGKLPWNKTLLKPLFKSMRTLKPIVIRKDCTACGACKKACPMKCIEIAKGEYSRIKQRNCIRCYCCHEMCPAGAIVLKPSVLYRMATKPH
jgi:Pyruvate/2-oxoacid:ferredoxin oxidoreductase delta subunit